MKQPIKPIALLLASSALAQPSVLAENLSSADNTSITPDAMASLEHMTVYGTSNPLPVLDYPGQVSVVDKDEIELHNPSSISDLLRDVPGLEFSGGPRRTGETPSIRGRGGENVLILLDGARQSFISAHDGRFFVDPELIRKAEVVKGPASALYGSGAVGGVLAFESIKAKDFLNKNETMGFRVRAGYQNANQEHVFSVTGYTLTENADILASINVRQSGDIALASDVDLPSDDDLYSGLFKLTYRVNDELSLNGSWQRFSNTAIEPNNGQGVVIADGDNTLNVEKDISSDTVRLGAHYQPANQSWIDLSLTTYQTDSEVEEFDISLPRTTTRKIETNGVSVRNVSQFSFEQSDVQFTVGADWFRDEQTGKDDNTQSGLRGGVPNAQASFTGLFAQLELNVNEPMGLPGELLVVPGVRYDRFETKTFDLSVEDIEDSAMSPRLAASYAPNNWLRVFASYSEAFRAPSVNELYLDGVHFSLPHPTLFDPQNGQFVFINNNFIANPDLKPERSDTVEVGFSIDLNDIFTDGDIWQNKVSYYKSDIEDLIDLQVDFAFDPGCFSVPFLPCTAGTSSSANVESASIDGVELESRYENQHVTINLTYSSIDGTNLSDGSDLGTLTPDRLNVDLRYKLQSLLLELGTRLQLAKAFERNTYDSETDSLVVSESRSGYGVVDIYASWQMESVDGLYLTLGVDNLFDRQYERVFEGVTEVGRNAKVSLAWTANF
ncbi:MAG: TonB-dependent hemoglobin/transferrin/lactoferrin family receptor [Aliiglaciecola sp.]